MNDLTKELIILRSVFDKSSQKLYTNPVKDPKTGRYPEHVKPVDSRGDIILKDAERNSDTVWIKENDIFVIQNGTTFDLNDPHQAAIWEAIKHNPKIAPSRDARDANGDLIIDGGAKRYGIAEYYIERPGYEAKKKMSKTRLVTDALNYIFGDSRDGIITKAKLLGKRMENMPSADIEEYLVNVAKKDPEKIIDLYTGTDTNLRILLMDAKAKHIIYVKNKVYIYADNIVLGATDDAVITWMKESRNRKVVQLIQKETYPDLYPDAEIEIVENTTVRYKEEEPEEETTKSKSKKSEK